MQVFFSSQLKKLELPQFSTSVSAGFPSPADGLIEKSLDLNDYVIKNPPATFFVRVSGDSMQKAGIFDGDVLVVDRSLDAKNNDIVIAILDSEFTVKRLRIEGEKVWLMPENEKYKDIEISDGMDLIIWGVVTNVVHKLR